MILYQGTMEIIITWTSKYDKIRLYSKRLENIYTTQNRQKPLKNMATRKMNEKAQSCTINRLR